MTTIDTEKMRTLLEKERGVLEKELARHGHKDFKTGNWQGSSDEYKTGAADQNEVADQIEELVINIPLVEDLERRYESVLAALKKIDGGTYGACEVGGEPIDPRRLEANPSARTCVKHAK